MISKACRHPFMSILVLLWSLAWVRYYKTLEGTDSIAIMGATALFAGGLFVFGALWRGSPNAKYGYAIWAFVDLIGLTLVDMRIEPIMTKVALGTALTACPLAAVAIVLFLAPKSVPQGESH